MKYCFLLLFLLGGCTPSPTKMPPYIVMLGQITPDMNGRCTGIALDQWRILTADHCLSLAAFRVETQYGQSVYAYPIQRFPDIDIALLQTALPLSLPGYALTGDANKNETAYLFGICPQHFAHVPRLVFFQEHDWFIDEGTVSCEKWITQTSSCGGDSGGLIIQDGKFVGMAIGVRSWWKMQGKIEGREVCIVPTNVIMEKLSWQTASNN